jgi:hypothetical protein
MLHNIISFLTVLEETAQHHPATVYGPLIDLGAVGACLVILGFYTKSRDARYEIRIDERIRREGEFQEKYIGLVEKQHSITEKFTATLDIVVTLLKQQQK